MRSEERQDITAVSWRGVDMHSESPYNLRLAGIGSVPTVSCRKKSMILMLSDSDILCIMRLCVLPRIEQRYARN